jgi:uncharacterized LabA/DUF88 family protein
MRNRVVLFIDYQNAYRRANAAFRGPGDRLQTGQFDPFRMGELIAARNPWASRGLAQVRVYRGRPDRTKDLRAHSANVRQSAAQEASGRSKVTVITRPLRYPADWPIHPAEEKGIDVALAVDFVMMAVRHEYDVGVIMSTDTDLQPALEAVVSLGGNPRCEVAAWTNPAAGHSRRIGVRGARIWCHWLDAKDYEAVADRTDYNVGPA